MSPTFAQLQPSPNDEMPVLLQKMAWMLYFSFGVDFGQASPTGYDPAQNSLYRIAAYLWAGSQNESDVPTTGGGLEDAYRIANGNFQLWNPTQQIYQTVSLTGAPGQEQLVIGVD